MNIIEKTRSGAAPDADASGTAAAKPAARAAIYVRCASYLPDDRAIERQVACCMEHAAAGGMDVHKIYVDVARSGLVVVGRGGLRSMLRDAEKRRFDVVVVEDVDRLARCATLVVALFEDLARHGVRVHVRGRGAIAVSELLSDRTGALLRDELVVNPSTGERRLRRRQLSGRALSEAVVARTADGEESWPGSTDA